MFFIFTILIDVELLFKIKEEIYQAFYFRSTLFLLQTFRDLDLYNYD